VVDTEDRQRSIPELVTDRLHINNIIAQHCSRDGATGLDRIVDYSMNAPGKGSAQHWDLCRRGSA
jgi:hypothetical protein